MADRYSIRSSNRRIPYHLSSKPAAAACNLNCKYCFFISKEKGLRVVSPLLGHGIKHVHRRSGRGRTEKDLAGVVSVVASTTSLPERCAIRFHGVLPARMLDRVCGRDMGARSG